MRTDHSMTAVAKQALAESLSGVVSDEFDKGWLVGVHEALEWACGDEGSEDMAALVTRMRRATGNPTDEPATVVVDTAEETVACPECGSGDIRLIDQATRRIPGEFAFEDGVLAVAHWSSQGSEFVTIGYACGGCGVPLRLPPGVDEEWD